MKGGGRAPVEATPADTEVLLPRPQRGPLHQLALRLTAAFAVLLLVALVAWLGGDGYRDGDTRGLSFFDAVYYASVSVTTTGYGDITPVTDTARLLTTLVTTPARILFLIILVGATVEVLAERSRATLRERTWRRTLKDHTIVCGYGTKGRSAIEVLLGHGRARDEIVVIDPDPANVEEARRDGYAVVQGDAARVAVLQAAGLDCAAVVIVAVKRDDAAVLTTLTAREHRPDVPIHAAVREEENRHLLHQSGATQVITSSAAAGRLLGFAAMSNRVVEVLEDLLTVGTGLDVVEKPIEPEHLGKPLSAVPATAPIMAVVRGERLLRFDDPAITPLREGDRLVCLCSN